MSRTLKFEVDAEIPAGLSTRPFVDRLIAGWGHLREEPVGPLEAIGIGFIWRSRLREGVQRSRLPSPWSLIRNGLVERKAISPAAHVYMLRGEVVPIGRTSERARLLVVLER